MTIQWIYDIISASDYDTETEPPLKGNGRYMGEAFDFLTERSNPGTRDIDTASTLELVRMINREDCLVAPAVGREADKIARAIDLIVEAIAGGGRLVYFGAGTSGRLGVLDAAECVPTYSTDPGLVVGLIAGGRDALVQAVENAEDDPEAGRSMLQSIGFGGRDILVALAASGRTPCVLGAAEYAREAGSKVISVSCCPGSALDSFADVGIAPEVGPEVISGSTRMKSGTAQKMVLNMLSTGAMVKLGKVYRNLMVDVKPTNQKLRRRSVRIICEAAGCTEKTAEEALLASHNRVKTAIVMLRRGLDEARSDELLERVNGHISRALSLGTDSEGACPAPAECRERE